MRDIDNYKLCCCIIVDTPRAYLDYLQQGNATEAFLTYEFPAYMQLWLLDDIAKYNRDYQVSEFAPGFLCFGSNGGGELLAFDEFGAVYCLPAIGMEPTNAIRVADSWSEFERHIEKAT